MPAFATPAPRLDEHFVKFTSSDRLQIPPYPAVAFRLRQLVDSGEYKIEQLQELIAGDQTLCATVLRHANAAAVGSDTTWLLRGAIIRLGSQELVRISLAASLAADAARPGHLAEIRRVLWRKSVMSAVLCQRLAEHRKGDESLAFVCGLLHDFGKLIAVSVIEQMTTSSDDEPMSAEVRDHIVERYHVELGMVIAERWNLPEPVAEAIRSHHQPRATRHHREVIDLVSIADRVIELIGSSLSVDETALDEALPECDPRERRIILQMIPSLPAIAHSFDSEPPPAKQRQPRAVTQASKLPTPRYPVNFPVINHVAAKVVYRSYLVSWHGMAIEGPVAMEECRLVRLRLVSSPEPFEIWASVSRCRKRGARFFIDLKPVALDGETKRAWESMCRVAQIAAEKSAKSRALR